MSALTMSRNSANPLVLSANSTYPVVFNGLAPARWPVIPTAAEPFISTTDKAKIFCYWWFAALADVVPDIITHIIPNVVRWLYRTLYTGEITRHSITVTIDGETKTAELYFHGTPKNGWHAKTPVVIVTPGDDAPPYSLLSLADIAKRINHTAVFSLCIPRPLDHSHPKIDRTLVTLAINQIQKIIAKQRVGTNQATLSHLDMVGHSRGGIRAAYQMFVKKDPRVDRVFAIGSRVRFNDSLMKVCDAGLTPTMNKLAAAIPSTPDKRFMQVIGTNDWCLPIEALAPHQPTLILKDASHCNAVSHSQTLVALTQFLQQA